jgi:hypothetical protein
MMGPAAAYADDTHAALEREKVDAMVCDYMLFGPPIAAERAGTPQTTESFDFPGKGHPKQVRYVGPILTDPRWAEAWHSPWPEDDGRPLVVVSFSSTYMAQERVLGRVIEGTRGLDARVLVTTGPAIDPDSLPHPDDVVIVRSAPHAQVFPATAVVITHAGMGTVTRALASGTPLVCLPMGRPVGRRCPRRPCRCWRSRKFSRQASRDPSGRRARDARPSVPDSSAPTERPNGR